MAKKQKPWGILTGNWVKRAVDVTDALIGEGYNYLSFSVNKLADPTKGQVKRKTIVLGLKVEVPESDRDKAVANIKAALMKKEQTKGLGNYSPQVKDRVIDIPITVGAIEKIYRIYVKPTKSGGSGGGAAQTAINECTFAVYASLRYNVYKNPLNPDIGISESDWEEAFKYCKLDKSKDRIGTPDMLWHVSHCMGANLLAERVKMKGTSKVIFYRGKEIDGKKTDANSLSKAYGRVKSELGGVTEDKWNPADVWMSVDGFESELDDKPKIDDVNNYILQLAGKITTNNITDATLVGISLKKLGATANFSILNAGTPQERKDAAKPMKFLDENRQGGYDLFFENRGANPIDFYLYYGSAKFDKFQCRNFGGKKASWQIELKGATAAHGRCGGGNVAEIVNKYAPGAMPWNNEPFYNQCNPDSTSNRVEISEEIANLLVDFKAKNVKGKKQWERDFKQYKSIISRQSTEWRYSKLNGLRLLKALEDNKGKVANQIVQALYLFASSQLDFSSVFVKVY